MGKQKEIKTIDMCIYHNDRNKPHEAIFVDLLISLCQKRSNLALELIFYTEQFYPEYNWYNKNYLEPLDTVLFECAIARNSFDINLLEKKKKQSNNRETLKKAMVFGDIVTDFFIRYLGYSLIQVANQKVIITSADNYHKKFIKHINKGFSLEIKNSVYKIMEAEEYLGNNLQDMYGYLPTLPRSPENLENDEYIEFAHDKFAR